jgi:signal transduction histidine kinase/ActR/RegA family two-component response regulator
MWTDLRTHWRARQWTLFLLALTPPNFRAGRLPFVFFSGLALMVVIGMLWLFTPDVGSQESRLSFIAFIALSLVLLNMGVPTQRVMTLVGLYATVHIGLAAYFGQGIFSPRINWLFLIPILMFHIDGRRAGLMWGGVVMGAFSGLALLNHWDALPHWTPMTHGHDVYAFLVYAVTATSLIAITLTYQGFSARAIAALRASNEELEARRQELQKILDIRDRFISSVSHELRTPMNAIMGFNDLLCANQAGNAKAMEVLALTQQSGEHLLTVINDVLDYSQFQSGKLAVNPQSFELRNTVDNATGLFAHRLSSMKLAFSHGVDDKLPTWVWADRHRLMQILVNLLGNAIKFTPQGCVSLSVRAEGDSILFEVQDTGIGIAEEKLSVVFDRFSQATDQTQNLYGGNGLGLTISKRLVELMGGSIGVRSRLGEGSCFWFKLPLKAGQAPPPSDLADAQQADMREWPWRFLVVDDVHINRMLLRQMLMLECPKAHISEAAHGLEALQAMQREAFDLVFMDMLMPQMDGIEACQRIRSELPAPARHTPVLGLTANVNANDKERFLQSGANDFLLKPFARKDLMQVTQRLLVGDKHPPIAPG